MNPVTPRFIKNCDRSVRGVNRKSTALGLIAFFALMNDLCSAEPALEDLDCVVQPSEVVDLSTAVSGLISEIRADRSDFVKKGDVIAKLESSVEIADAKLSATQAATNTLIELREASLMLGYITKERNQQLMRKSLISRQEIDNLNTDFRIAELNLKLEQDNKRLSKIASTRAQAILDRRSIISPVDGVVVERYKSVGERSNDDPIVRIVQLDPLHIEVVVPAQHHKFITEGMIASVQNNTDNSIEYQATVERIDKVFDAASGTFGVRLTVDNPDFSIPAGTLCSLDFQLSN